MACESFKDTFSSQQGTRLGSANLEDSAQCGQVLSLFSSYGRSAALLEWVELKDKWIESLEAGVK